MPSDTQINALSDRLDKVEADIEELKKIKSTAEAIEELTESIKAELKTMSNAVFRLKGD